MSLAIKREDVYCGFQPHLTNYRGEVLYASLLEVVIGDKTTVQCRYSWTNPANIGDAFFSGIWRQEVSEFETDPEYKSHEIAYYPVNPDPSQSLIIMEGGDK